MPHRYGLRAAGLAVIAIMIVYYSENISTKISLQSTNLMHGKWTYPQNVDRSLLQRDIEAIRTITGNSEKLYFVSASDFQYYYYGGYMPVGYVNPFWAWIFTKPFSNFLQERLQEGYYLVFTPETKYLLESVALQYDLIESAGEISVVVPPVQSISSPPHTQYP